MPTNPREAESDSDRVVRRRRTNGTGANAHRRSRQEHANLINAGWRRTLESVLETGSRLKEAKQELDPADYRAMVDEDLLMAAATARKLRIIASNPVLSDRSHVNSLPASFTTLYELTQLKHDDLRALIEDGTINPKLERAEATALRNGGDAAQPANVERRRAPSAQPRPAANGHSWSQHDQVDEPGEANDLVEDLIDEIAELFDPLRARIEQVRNGRRHGDAKAALADALREHAATATRLADGLTPGEVDA
jgi:hypothetical protein